MRDSVDLAVLVKKMPENQILLPGFFEQFRDLQNMAILRAIALHTPDVLRRSALTALVDFEWSLDNERRRILEFCLRKARGAKFKPDDAAKTLVVIALELARRQNVSIEASGFERNFLGQVVDYLDHSGWELNEEAVRGWVRFERRKNTLNSVGLDAH